MNAQVLQETFTELEDIAYSAEDLLPEIVLFCSLLLRDRATFTTDLSYNTEARKEIRRNRSKWFSQLIPNVQKATRELYGTKLLPSTDLLPDVCIQCCTSFGLTISGRLRTVCPQCAQAEWTGGQDGVRYSLTVQEELGAFCIPTALFEQVIAQLIYKYYSPNGDRTWVLSLPILQQ